MRQVASKDSQHSFKSFFLCCENMIAGFVSLHRAQEGESSLWKPWEVGFCFSIAQESLVDNLFVPGILTISRVLRLLGHNGKHGWRSRCWIHLWGEIWDNWAEKGPWLHDLENGQENGLQVGFKFLIKTGSNFSWIIWWTFQRAPVDQWKGKWELQHGLHKQATFTKSDISESNQNTKEYQDVLRRRSRKVHCETKCTWSHAAGVVYWNIMTHESYFLALDHQSYIFQIPVQLSVNLCLFMLNIKCFLIFWLLPGRLSLTIW